MFLGSLLYPWRTLMQWNSPLLSETRARAITLLTESRFPFPGRPAFYFLPFSCSFAVGGAPRRSRSAMQFDLLWDAIYEWILRKMEPKWRQNGVQIGRTLNKTRIAIALDTDVCFKCVFSTIFLYIFKDFQTSFHETYVKNNAKTMVFTSPIAMRPYRLESCFLSLSVLF